MTLRTAFTFMALSIAGLSAGAADAAVLIESELQGRAMRMVVAGQRVEIRFDKARYLVDLDAGQIYEIDETGRSQRSIPTVDRTHSNYDAFQIKPWGPGPIVAGHASVYHVLSRAEQICSEVLVSAWMKPFLAPAVQAIDLLGLLDRVGAQTGKQPCPEASFAGYAATGWPLMVGSMDEPIFKTEAISFDYKPVAADFDLSN